MPASFTASPASIPLGGPTQITLTGSGTSWTASTTFAVAPPVNLGIAAPTTVPTISGLVVNAAAQTVTFTLSPGSGCGALAITDSVDPASTSASVTVTTWNLVPITVGTGLPPAHPTAGVSIDPGEIQFYANLVRSCLFYNPAANPNASTNVPVDGRNSPTTDFSLNARLIDPLMIASGATCQASFAGQATLAASYCSWSNQVYNAATNTTTATLNIPPGCATPFLYFSNTRRTPDGPTNAGLDAEQLYVMLPVAPGSTTCHATTELFTRAIIAAMEPLKENGGHWRDLDAGIISNVPDLPVQDVTNRTMPFSAIQTLLNPTRGISIEDRIKFANKAGLGWWTCFPDNGTRALWQLTLDICAYGSDHNGVPYTGAAGANPWPAGLVGNAVNPPLDGRLLFEFSDEVWNQFAQAPRVAAAALANYNTLNASGEVNPGDGSPPLALSFCHLAWTLLWMADAAEAQWPGGLKTKYCPILAWQSSGGSPNNIGPPLTWLRRHLSMRGQQINQVIAGAGGDGYQGMLVNVGDSNQTVASVLAGGFGGNDPNPGMPQDGMITAANGLDYYSYEGGLSVGDNPLADAVTADPGFRAVALQQLLNWVRCGCQGPTFYALKKGQWKLLLSVHDLTYPPFLAWCDFLSYYRNNGTASATLPAPVAPCFAGASFEVPSLNDLTNGFAYQPSGSGWTFAQSAGISASLNGFVNQGQPILDGKQVAFLQGTGSFSQSVNFPAAGSYAISGQMNGRIGNTSPLAFDVLVDGVVVGSFTPAVAIFSQAFATAPVAVTAGSHTIMFRTTSSQDLTVLLDDLAIAPAGVVIGPPPPTTLAALVLDYATRRHRRARITA